MVGTKPTAQGRAKRLERLRHVLWAGLISLVLAVLSVLDPVDQFLWVTQSRAISTEASGEIVYLASRQDLSDPNFPERRQQLTQALRRLEEGGAERVFIDSVFEDPTDEAIDGDLNEAILEFSGDAYLVADYRFDATRELQLAQSNATIARGVDQVGSDLYKNYLGYIWAADYTIQAGESQLPSLAAEMANATGGPDAIFPINYNIALSSIPSVSLEEFLSNDSAKSRLAGKTVVIGGRVSNSGTTYNIPGTRDVPSTIVHIYAAETLIAGKTGVIANYWTALAAILLLALASIIRQDGIRRSLYATIVVLIPIGLAAAAISGWRADFADLLALCGAFGAFRLRSKWKDSFALLDPETNLPTFAALEADRSIVETVPAIIVAKIHRFEQVRRTLPKDLHSEYVLRIIKRLKAATQDATIYRGEGHMIAWTMPEKEPALVQEHLEGLRALFSSPLIVGDRQVDVGITFGVDITPSPNVVRRLASAVAVAEQTNETYDPIAIADTTSEEDLIWNISLQARIDAALSNGEIYLVFQPKIMVQTGEIIGVEALVRWKDPVKGHIPPDNFIRQCETAGRMSQLTHFVLEKACKAGTELSERGFNLPVAVNISATLVHERAIVQMVSDALKKTGFEPNSLTLEITETYRISNIDRAAEILGELRALGTKISMDDFGVGAASLEALLRLPFAELKIDRMFISRMIEDDKAAGIVKNILQLGKDLRIIVVAEGVEDAGTLTKLRDSGCLVAQGFAISRPVTLDKILQYQKDNRTNIQSNMV
ncbi:EAL domain-containing protein [Erythrobacter alti]|uniref:EAL domain-containing protein n=1 Tax=Erythrobacter alti TaxID=1896145 RepID=UPI0030F46E61